MSKTSLVVTLVLEADEHLLVSVVVHEVSLGEPPLTPFAVQRIEEQLDHILPAWLVPWARPLELVEHLDVLLSSGDVGSELPVVG